MKINELHRPPSFILHLNMVGFCQNSTIFRESDTLILSAAIQHIFSILCTEYYSVVRAA